MKTIASVVLVLCGLSLVNCFPSIYQSEEPEVLDCVPTDGWNVIATAYCGIFGTETKKYQVVIGTDFEGSDEESEDFFKLFGDTLGKILVSCRS